MSQIRRLVPEARFDLEHEAVEVYREADRADLALSKPIVKHVVDIGDADAGLGGARPIDQQALLDAADVVVPNRVCHLGHTANVLQQGSAPADDLILVQSGHGILIAVDAADADLHILCRNKESPDAVKLSHFAAQSIDHLFNRFLTNAQRL